MAASVQNRFGEQILKGEFTADVINKYHWFQKRSLTEEELKLIPRIILTEYQMSQNGLYSTLRFYQTATKQVSEKDPNPYKDLYSAKATGKKFIFPYFSEALDNHSSSWQVAKDLAESTGLDLGGILKEGTKFVDDSIKAYKAVRTIFQKDKVSSYKVSPYIWKSTMGMHPTIDFNLYNTPLSPEEDRDATYIQNQSLVNYLRIASTFDQIGPFEAAPPSIFTVQIPGVYYMPAATIESFQLKSIGSVINVNGVFIPEGFNVNIVLQPLVPSSHGVTYAGAYSNVDPGLLNSVNAITDIDENQVKELSDAEKKAKDEAERKTADSG